MGERSGPRAGDTTRYGNPLDFDVDLHSVYAAYIGLFESSAVDWWDRSWGGYFQTFNDFLGVKWEVMVVVDSETGRAHIATRRDEIVKFAKHIKTRFGESLQKEPPTTLPLSPVPTKSLALRRLSNIQDLTAFRKLSQTLQAAELTYLRSRVRGGEVDVIEQLFYAGGPGEEWSHKGAGVRDNGVGYTWACITTTWWEKGGPAYGLVPGQGRVQTKGSAGKGLPLEVGMAVVRCANLRAVDVWPPVPDVNYRKSHFISEEWVDKRTNTAPPSYPRAYGFGKSRYVNEKDVEKIVEATLGALATQENDNNPNQLILISLGEPAPLPMSITSTLPSNILQVDIYALEYSLLLRAQANRIANTPDRRTPLASLSALLQTLQIPISAYCPLGNAGNEAFYTVLAFQKLMMADTQLPDLLFQHQPYPMPQQTLPQYPLPQHPPFATPDSRRQSSSSFLRPESYVAPPPRRASDNVRPRPNSMARGSAPGITRSQTVFWDDADFAADPNRQGGGSTRGRMPALKTSASSRSVSWEDGSDLHAPHRNHESSNPSSPRREHPLASSSSSVKDARSPETGPSSQSDEPKVEQKAEASKSKNGKEAKPKLKSEKSVKDIAGALAKFWVG